MSKKHLYQCVYTGKKQKKYSATNQLRGQGSEQWKNNLWDEKLAWLGDEVREEPEGKKSHMPRADEEKAKRLEVTRVVDVDETGRIGQPLPVHGTEGRLKLRQHLNCYQPQQEVNTSGRPLIRVHFQVSYSKRKEVQA
jgi:hypothetical protein